MLGRMQKITDIYIQLAKPKLKKPISLKNSCSIAGEQTGNEFIIMPNNKPLTVPLPDINDVILKK